MAFEQTATKINAINNASALLSEIQNIYRNAKTMQQKLALYNAGTDPAFNAAINAIYTQNERQTLGAMLTLVSNFVTQLETTYSDILTNR